ncbi:MAG: hypothetical protein Q4E55_03440 [Bacteroidales bacterium]|nr:hypothetical protein [Bacteroidales bacterium]
MTKTKFFCLFMACCAALAQAQETKNVRVDADTPYQEKIQIAFDDKGLELDLTLAFEEAADELVLTLSGNRDFMAFRQDVSYNDVFTHPFLGKRRLHAEKLQYKVLVEPNSKYYLRESVYKSYRKKRRHHLINAWVEPNSASLTIACPATYLPTSATDSPQTLPKLSQKILTQRFKVNPEASDVTLRIRNIMVVDVLKDTQKGREYEIVFDHDLDLTCRVALARNPCHGQQEALAVMKAKLMDIRKAYRKLHQICPSGKVESAEEVGVFKQHQEFLLSKFQPIETKSSCADVNMVRDSYNNYVDSIESLKCAVPVELTEEGSVLYGTGISPEALVRAARQLDKLVAQNLVAKNELERRDIYFMGRDIINVTKQGVEEKGIYNEEQRRAYGIFDTAAKYFFKHVSEFE